MTRDEFNALNVGDTVKVLTTEGWGDRFTIGQELEITECTTILNERNGVIYLNDGFAVASEFHTDFERV